MKLEQLVRRAAAAAPAGQAVRGPDRTLSYGELDALANRFARVLAAQGVRAGDRVGLFAEKSADLVAAMQGVLRLGAAYVPLDPLNPLARARLMIEDCALKAVVTTTARAAELRAAGVATAAVALDGDGRAAVERERPDALPPPDPSEDQLAYVLYTSGSTGKPKGVCLSHRNAWAFVDWAHGVLEPTARDVFSNHAPFFFDLSVLDLYVAFQAGAPVALVPEALAFAPHRLVDFLVREQITLWYSVPSALIMMAEQGGLLERSDARWRVIIFAGEPYPVKHLRNLQRAFPNARLLNLYGPTETNVCTWYEVPGRIPDDQHAAVPIGKACSGDRVWMEHAPGDPPDVGELLAEGPSVMLGYWGLPPHVGPYRTGDLVRQTEAGDYVYLGRNDHMLKVRGRRMEPQEIEAAILSLPSVEEVAVAAHGTGLEAKLVAFAVARVNQPPPSLLEVKQACASKLPRHMIVDELRVVQALPRTANGKIDRKRLLVA